MLRGEPLVPLSHVTFAEEAGRPGPGATAGKVLAIPVMAPSRKRVAATRSAGDRSASA